MNKNDFLRSLPALDNNLIWLYGRANLPLIVVDLPDFAPLWDFVQQHNLKIEALLITHKHQDHWAGVPQFKARFPNAPIFGPAECADKGLTQVIGAGQFATEHYQIEAIETAGHTEQHLCYFIDGVLFSGDTLFVAGCGRVFTGDYGAMFDSLQRLKQLPLETQICVGHDYTLSNLAFAETVLADKRAGQNEKVFYQQQRAADLPFAPSSLARELEINPFLQAADLDQFIQLRQAKDNF